MRDPYCIEEDVRKRISECYLRVINDAEEQIKKVTADEEQGIQRYPSDNISIIWACHSELYQCGMAVFSAMYSLGEKIEALHPYFDISVNGLKNMYQPMFHKIEFNINNCYDALLDLISIGILLEIDDDTMKVIADGARFYHANDALVDFLLSAYDIGWEHCTGKFYLPRPYQYTKDIIQTAQEDKEEASRLLEEYVKKKWLSGNGYKNAHKEKGYIGVWSYDAAALAKILGLDDSCFKGKKNYPYDLAHYKNARIFSANAYSKWLIKVREKEQGAERLEKEKVYIRELEEDYLALGAAAFYEKYKERFLKDLFFDEAEYRNYRMAGEEGILGFLLVNMLVTDGYILQMDYKDGPEEYLIDFVNERLETDYGKDMIEEPESDDESENMDAEIELYDTKYVKSLGRKLKRKGFRFVWFLIDSDQYYVCIMPKTAVLGKKWHEIRLKVD